MVMSDLRRLRILRELGERGTLAAVAAVLDYSPSAISQQLAVLEREVGHRLIEPAGRGVRLTDAGRLLAQHAAALITAGEAAEAELDSAAGVVRGRLRVVGLQSATRKLLIPALVDLATEHPAVEVEITETEVEQALPELRLGTVDLVISDEYDGYPRPRPAGLDHTLLLREPIRLVLPADHPLAAPGTAVPLPALCEAVWTASHAGTGHRTMIIGTCRALGGFDPDLRHHSNDSAVQLELVRTTGAVTLLPDLILPPDDPRLAIRSIADAHLGRVLHTVTRHSAASPALRAYLAAVTRHAATNGEIPTRAADR